MATICEQFVKNSTISHNSIIVAKQSTTPIVPTSRWEKIDDKLQKTYTFKSLDERDVFLQLMLAYEKKTQHYAKLTIKENKIMILVYTEGVDTITLADKEYARSADTMYKEVVYYVI